MEKIRIVFFGSTSDSVSIAEVLKDFRSPGLTADLVAVVTQPPKPTGRKQIITPTPVEIWGRKNKLPVLSFPAGEKAWEYADDDAVVGSIESLKPDLLVTACYGQKIPVALIRLCRYGGLNVHPSLLPRWRGADPLPWTIVSGDAQTGVSISTIAESFDQGEIVRRKKIAVPREKSPDTLRTELFVEGANLISECLPGFISGSEKPVPQNPAEVTYARKLTRTDGFIPWDIMICAMDGKTSDPEKLPPMLRIATNADPRQNLVSGILLMLRALTPWPGVWTQIDLKSPEGTPTTKRLKLLAAHAVQDGLIPDTVQLEGRQPVSWKQFREAYLDSGKLDTH